MWWDEERRLISAENISVSAPQDFAEGSEREKKTKKKNSASCDPLTQVDEIQEGAPQNSPDILRKKA